MVKEGIDGILVESVELDNLTISSDTYDETSFSMHKDGYRCIGLAGCAIRNATTGGTRGSYCMYYMAYMTDDEMARLCVRNTSSSQAVIRKIAYGIYIPE